MIGKTHDAEAGNGPSLDTFDISLILSCRVSADTLFWRLTESYVFLAAAFEYSILESAPKAILLPISFSTCRKA